MAINYLTYNLNSQDSLTYSFNVNVTFSLYRLSMQVVISIEIMYIIIPVACTYVQIIYFN